MRGGYLYLLIHCDHPKMIRVLASPHSPATGDNRKATTNPYVARFEDIDAAKMHFHNTLRHKLLDSDAGLYRASLTEAIAAIESIELPHRRVWLDPIVGAGMLQQMESIAEQHRRKHRRNDMIWRAVGAMAIFLLLLKMVGSFF